MPDKSLKYLADIKDAAEFILQSVQEKSLRDYQEDRLLRQAIERNFEIIGEAVGRLRKSAPDLLALIEHAQQIISFRNLLIHGYDMVDSSVVWQVIQDDLPNLLRDVRNIADP